MSQTTKGCLGASLPGNKRSAFMVQFFMSNLEHSSSTAPTATPRSA